MSAPENSGKASEDKGAVKMLACLLPIGSSHPYQPFTQSGGENYQ
jgi:hypothetical protein